jgi:hypothetical protein
MPNVFAEKVIKTDLQGVVIESYYPKRVKMVPKVWAKIFA